MVGSSVGSGRRQIWRRKRKVDLGGLGWVCGIGRMVVVKDSTSNVRNSMFIEEKDRKNFCFF